MKNRIYKKSSEKLKTKYLTIEGRSQTNATQHFYLVIYFIEKCAPSYSV